MTAPIFFEKEYKLNSEIEQDGEGRIFLRIEKIYTYDNVWEARNAYEKFFSKSYRYDGMEIDQSNDCYDRWINMIGDEECMIVKQVYVYQHLSFQQAQIEEKREKDILAEITRKNEWRQPKEEDDIELFF